MDIKTLSQILADNYNDAYNGEMVAQIHLFGIKYGKIIKLNGFTAKEIINNTGINESYVAELNKGIKLSNFLELPDEDELNIEQLGRILKSDYENANDKESVASIHLFGIKYGQQIRRKNYSPNDILKLSELSPSYITELQKGIKLSKFICVK